ncbi:YpmS family protein [Sporosarcina sp. GW1-11]|uniref:YpmS family protein n=1 Tax=Sporosarcina sp. GW1-11 TaxID=2899126 RepID=UPI00294CC1A6|nr:YpmS family protein [Sporosarcina sp. GW1-11]MDV6377122.1 YpmS family protein [Sporosarcina sp. GW1-11]
MKFWKVAFFSLAGLVAAALVALILLVSGTTASPALPESNVTQEEGYTLALNTTKDNFEGIANTYIRKAVKGALPVELSMRDDVLLTSELTVFSYTLPLAMHFDPIVQDDGNLILKQSSMELGHLTIPPSTVLKLLKNSMELPSWMIVRPKEEEIFIDLRELPISGDVQVKAKEVNLAKDEIILEVLIPKN